MLSEQISIKETKLKELQDAAALEVKEAQQQQQAEQAQDQAPANEEVSTCCELS